MTRRTRILLALVLAAGTALTVWLYLSSLQPDQTVIVVTRDIAPHALVTREMLRVERVHAGSLKVLVADAFTKFPGEETLVATRQIRAGEVLRNAPDMVAAPRDLPKLAQEQRVPLSALVPAGHRAVTLPLDQEVAVRAGDLVDLFRTSTGEVDRQVRSEALLRGVKVLLGGGTSRTITVLVLEGQTGQVIEALRSGKVDIVLAPLEGGAQ